MDKPAPHPAQPAPTRQDAALHEKQAPTPAQEPAAALEARAFLGDNPLGRRLRWDDLVRRTQDKPAKAVKPDDTTKALHDWIASRKKRGLPASESDMADVIQRIERYGWTSERILARAQEGIDDLNDRIAALEKSGRRLFGSNRNAQQIALIEDQRDRSIAHGNAEIKLARDYEAFRPGLIEREHAQRLQAWQRDVALRERIEPYAKAIIERDEQEQERLNQQARAERGQQKRPQRDRGRGMSR